MERLLQALFFPQMKQTWVQWTSDRVLMMAFAIATVVHVFVLMITFANPSPHDVAMRDVTIAVHLDREEVKQADFFAQQNQLGSGTLNKAARMKTPDHSDIKSDQMNYVNPNPNTIQAQDMQALRFENRILTTTLSWEDVDKREDKKENKKNQSSKEKVNSTAAMIATLEAEYAQTKQSYAKAANVRTVDSVSAQKDPSAAYVNEFRRIVEGVGNRYYPQEARDRQLTGDVRLLVIILPDGRVKAISLKQSSGSAILDEAAKASVRHGAPYPKFDLTMRDYAELRIIRTWRFSPQGKAVIEVTN